MVGLNVTNCPNCGGLLIHYDTVDRIVRHKGRVSTYIKIRRLRCRDCGKLHREIPTTIIRPYKQYESEIINGVIEGLITSDTLGFENYPCEQVMKKWMSERIPPPHAFAKLTYSFMERRLTWKQAFITSVGVATRLTRLYQVYDISMGALTWALIFSQELQPSL